MTKPRETAHITSDHTALCSW